MYSYKNAKGKPIPEINEYLEILGVPVVDAILSTLIWMFFYIFTGWVFITIFFLILNLFFCRWKNKQQNIGDPIELHPMIIKFVNHFKIAKYFFSDSASVESVEDVYRE